jgi:WD40 repeat protein
MLWSIDPYTGEMKSERVVQEGRGCTQRDITSMMFSPDGASMFCGTTSGDFMIASVRAKTLGAAVAACSAGARCVLALDSGGVAVGGGDGTVTIFDRSMRDIAQVELTGRVMGLSKSADGQELLASTDAGHIYRIEAKSMGAALVAESHRSPVRTVSYSRHTSDLFATAAADGTINVWDAGSYRAIASAVVKVSCGLSEPASSRLAPTARTHIFRAQDAGEPLCLVFTADMLLTGWDDGRLRSHDWETGRLLWQIDSAHLDGVTALAVSHNERYLLTGGEHGELRIWELRSREMVAHLKQHRQRVGSVVLFGDDIHALSVSRDRCLICWDLRAERQVSAHSQRMGGINAVALVHDESRVLTVGQEKRFTMWNLADPSPTLMGDLSPDMDDEAKALTVSHCGRFFATAGTGRTVKLWDVSTGSLVSEGLGHSGSISALQFSPDDKQLVSVGNDGIIIWNLYA